ncbi:tripartite tricarboxylate transporter permease [Halopelagius longus]|uniref:Putative membrane protein n=2 Tax=Halopelagius longus TaxID=1236180 RepID=A0A1H0Z3M5_9EURY|nr:tripartite tricarboxylate transporter permease [Halopelagius longus]SDQ22039.1 putative membrane protein [Halopelagius longus]
MPASTLEPAATALASATASAAPAATTLAFALCGVALGSVSGLVPGLHANAFALALAAAAPSLPGPPTAVAAAILAAGVVHTFLDVVPGLVLGVPDAATAPASLPGHRLVLAGCGTEALRLSALGSIAALCVAVPLSVPLSHLVSEWSHLLRAWLPVLLAAVVCLLVWAEPTRRARVAGVGCFLLAAALGFLTLDLPAGGPLAPAGAASMLAPLFAGLFGAPVVLDSVDASGPIPPQAAASVGLSPGVVARSALSGVGGGVLVGYLPGVSAGVAAVLALGGSGGATPNAGEATDRAYLVATSGADTATAVFAVGSLAVVGAPRNGVTVALSSAASGGVPLGLSGLLSVVVLAGGAGAVLVPFLGDRYLRLARSFSHRRLSLSVLALLWALSFLFAGLLGACAFAVAAVVGLLPPRFGARRVHLMGVLVGPVLVG